MLDDGLPHLVAVAAHQVEDAPDLKRETCDLRIFFQKKRYYLGTPASSKSCASIHEVTVVISDGFTTTVLPAIKAGATWHTFIHLKQGIFLEHNSSDFFLNFVAYLECEQVQRQVPRHYEAGDAEGGPVSNNEMPHKCAVNSPNLDRANKSVYLAV